MRRFFIPSLAVLAGAVFAASHLIPPSLAAGSVVSGVAEVIDADTLSVGEVRVRLAGTDAPEKSQTCIDASGKEYGCGKVAAAALSAFLADGPTECVLHERDRYGRWVGSCIRDSDGSVVQAWLIQNGFALNWTRYGGPFEHLQDEAAAAHRGIHSGTFKTPCEWRAEKAKREPRC